jgi:4-aminobutyrate aminotransferase/(S)-3-amino-2-methylpropionate transaminase
MDSVHAGGLGGTYGGNPLACAAAQRIESVLRPGPAALADKHEVIGEVRGRGAMLAVEIVTGGSQVAMVTGKNRCDR